MIKQKLIPYLLAFLMLIASIEAYLLTPKPDPTVGQAKLADVIPDHFGDWHAVPTSAQVIDPGNQRDTRDPFFTLYDDVLMRAYQNSRGDVVFLALAYGRRQRQEFKIHRPELCYVAQGFQLIDKRPVQFPIKDPKSTPITGSRMLVQSPMRVEIVSFWIRIGDNFTESAWATRFYLLQQGLHGQVRDGILVRASQIVSAVEDGTEERYELQEQFLSELVRASPPLADTMLIG